MAVASLISAALGWGIFVLGAVVPIYIAFGLIGLSGFRELTRYDYSDRFYYRLNPATKILCLFLVAISSSTAGLYLGLIVTILILTSFITLANGKRKLWIGALFTVAVVWSTVWGSISDRISFVIGGGLSGSSAPSLFFYGDLARIVAGEVAVSGVFLLALVLVMTSTPASVMRALRQIRIPNPITFSIIVGMKSVPLLLEAINTTVKVQFMRGYGTRGSRSLGPLYTIAAVLLSLIPALIMVLRGARNIAISTGTRAFGAFETRTYLRRPPFGSGDAIMVVLAVILVVTSLMR